VVARRAKYTTQVPPMGDRVDWRLQETEELLRRWADAVRGEERLSPWPRQSVLAVIQRYGPGGACSLREAGPEPLTDELMDVDAAIAALDSTEKQALVMAMLYAGREPRMLLARALGMSLDRFNRQLGRARRRVHDILEGIRIARRKAA